MFYGALIIGMALVTYVLLFPRPSHAQTIENVEPKISATVISSSALFGTWDQETQTQTMCHENECTWYGYGGSVTVPMPPTLCDKGIVPVPSDADCNAILGDTGIATLPVNSWQSIKVYICPDGYRPIMIANADSSALRKCAPNDMIQEDKLVDGEWK